MEPKNHAKKGSPKTVDWSPIVLGISIWSHILARLLIDECVGRVISCLDALSLSLVHLPLSLSYLSPSLLHLPQTHTHKHKLYLSLFWAKYAFSKSHYTYTWNPEYDKNSLNDSALIGHSINVLAKELVHSPPLHILGSNPNPFDRTNSGIKT